MFRCRSWDSRCVCPGVHESFGTNSARMASFVTERVFAPGSRPIGHIHAALSRFCRLFCGLLRGLLRLTGIGVVLPMAIAHAAIIRVTTNPTATALARSRATWFHRWSVVTCWILGLQGECHGFIPVSGLVIVDDLSPIDVLLLASVTPFVFVVDMGVRRRPVLGGIARLAGTLFRDRQRRSDIARTNCLIERALRRRQLVVIFRTCSWFRGPVHKGFPSALLQSAADTQCSLTAAAVHHQQPRRWNTAIGLLMPPRSRVTIAFNPPVFHYGDRKQLAEQVWREVQVLKNGGVIEAPSIRPFGRFNRDTSRSLLSLVTSPSPNYHMDAETSSVIERW